VRTRTVGTLLALAPLAALPFATPTGDLVLAGISAASLFTVYTTAAVWDRRTSDLRALARVLADTRGGGHHLVAPVVGGTAEQALALEVNAVLTMLRERALADQDERALDRAMVRETPNGLMVTDGRGAIRRHNPAFARLLPVAGPVEGRLPAEVIPVPELAQALEEARASRQVAERTVSVGGRDLLLRALPLADGVGCMGVALDITSVRAAERARRDFSANVSHELRTPITAILGWSEALRDERDTLPAPTHAMVDAIDRNARRLAALVEDVLKLARIEAGSVDLPVARHALAPLVHAVVERHTHTAEARGVALQADVDAALTAQVNPDALEHALGNLVGNALKYTPAGGRVRVHADAGDADVALHVADTGPGIAEEHHARLFERFYRVDDGRAREAGGTGLGLALVKHLCRAMGADVTVTSAVGAGSTFTLRLRG
jgi:two-component system phosphate regulon sensor histidine kinase PhoR